MDTCNSHGPVIISGTPDAVYRPAPAGVAGSVGVAKPINGVTASTVTEAAAVVYGAPFRAVRSIVMSALPTRGGLIVTLTA